METAMTITRDSLMTLEAYAKARSAMRAEVMEQKKLRRVKLGEHILLIFENELLIRYQIQEMLRVEKIFEEDGIRHELESYVPLVPTGSNFKVTMQIEYTDEAERKRMLGLLKGVEDRVWVRVDGFDPVFAIADEDLERENAEKTSAVHFLRFELSAGMVAAAKGGAAIAVGVDHPEYTVSTGPLSEPVRASLAADLR
ncbi:MAG: hypothetical protein FD157_2331 [Rhodocyclaceae bacterium]|nr:MAG: hypothetical protein FD157_2331 [Rhodocyclaceae bacterium]TND04111.1 MAG: hypothetical protein FD118_969 [Rhodocyclaceae bacterium]